MVAESVESVQQDGWAEELAQAFSHLWPRTVLARLPISERRTVSSEEFGTPHGGHAVHYALLFDPLADSLRWSGHLRITFPQVAVVVRLSAPKC